jgi:hypothetical protein
MRLLDVICAGDTLSGLQEVGRGCLMGLMKKSHLRGWKTPRCVCPNHERRVRQTPVQLDLFGYGDYFYHEGRMLYVVSQKEDVSSCEPS